MDVATIKKKLENQIIDINKELENIYLPYDAVLILLGKRTAFGVALKLVDSLQQDQPEMDLDEEIDTCWQNWLSPSNQKEVEGVLPKTEFATYARHFYEQAEKDTIERAESHIESVLLNFLDVYTVKWIIKDFKKAMEDK